MAGPSGAASRHSGRDATRPRYPPTASPPRYWLLETLRHYGRQRLRELGEQTATQQRHFDWICALAEKAGACDATQARAFKRMSGEIFVPNGPVITVTRAPRVPESLTSCCARTMSGAVQTPAEFGLSV